MCSLGTGLHGKTNLVSDANGKRFQQNLILRRYICSCLKGAENYEVHIAV